MFIHTTKVSNSALQYLSGVVRALRYISLHKIVNIIRLRISFHYSQITRKSKLLGMPWALSIEPTTHCNLRCPECPSGLRSFTRETGNMTMEDFKAIIIQLHKVVIHLNLYFQGEPFLNSHLSSMVAFAHMHHIHTSISTNGHYMNEKIAESLVNAGLDQIIFSIDGVTPSTYAAYRIGGNLDAVLKNMSCLASVKKRLRSKYPKIIWQTVIFSHNEHEVEWITAHYRNYGADALQLKTAQLYRLNSNDLLPRNPKWTRYKKDSIGYQIKNTLENKCWRMWSSSVITWNGYVIPCCFDKDAEYRMGSLKTERFYTIWTNTAYDNFRKTLLDNRKSIKMCQNCTEGSKVWA